MIYLLGVVAVITIIIVYSKRGPRQDIQREVLYEDGEVEIVVINGLSGLVNGEHWKAIFAFPVDHSILARIGLRKKKLLLRIAQSPTNKGLAEGGFELKCELTIPDQGLRRTFQDLRYLDFNPARDGAPGKIELMVDDDVYRIASRLTDPQAKRVVETFREWLTKNTMKFAWEGVATKEKWSADSQKPTK